jgi:UDP-GlcNAc:undecaprenyl-phosphate GlcNAc-1-phosphate transferase
MFPSTVPSWTVVLGELWGTGVWVLLAALLVSLLATPVMRWLALRRGIVDRPDHAVKIHPEPIPRLGGCAIWLGWTIAMVVHLASGRAGHPRAELALILGGTVAFLTGLVDDLRDLPPRWKLLGQAAAGGVLLAGGIVWRAFPGLLTSLGFHEDSWFVWAVCIGMHFFVVLGGTNAANLLDGLDGLCSGVTAIISIGFLLLATSLAAHHVYGRGLDYQYPRLIILVAFALVGAAIGFLPYNLNPARIFMGDAGSVFIGYVLAAMMIMFASKFGMVKWFVGALFIFGIPILDTAMALVRRIANRRPLMMPDRSHLYNQLMDRLGLTIPQSVGVFYGLSVLSAAAGLLVLCLRGRHAAVLYVLLAAAFLAAVWRLGFLRMTPDEKAAADRYLARKRGAAPL